MSDGFVGFGKIPRLSRNCVITEKIDGTNAQILIQENTFGRNTIENLGSEAAPGFMDPEGIIIYHEAAKQYFKKTIKDDEVPKGSKEIE